MCLLNCHRSKGKKKHEDYKNEKINNDNNNKSRDIDWSNKRREERIEMPYNYEAFLKTADSPINKSSPEKKIYEPPTIEPKKQEILDFEDRRQVPTIELPRKQEILGFQDTREVPTIEPSRKQEILGFKVLDGKGIEEGKFTPSENGLLDKEDVRMIIRPKCT